MLVESQIVQGTSNARYSIGEPVAADKRTQSYKVVNEECKLPGVLKQSAIIATVHSSPIKAVRFTYQHSPQRSSSPRYSETPTRGHTNSISFSGPSHPNLLDHATKYSPLTKQSTQPKVYFSP